MRRFRGRPATWPRRLRNAVVLSVAVTTVLAGAVGILLIHAPAARRTGAAARTDRSGGLPLSVIDPQFTPSVLRSPDPELSGLFGASVALTSAFTVVGAPGEEANYGYNFGHVYIQNRANGTVTILSAPSTVYSEAAFGSAVAASGTVLVVGAPEETVNGTVDAGAAYLFNITTGRLLASYFPPILQTDELFGKSVAISGSTVVVGAPAFEPQGTAAAGAIVIINTASGRASIVTAPNPVDDQGFGGAVAISGNTVAVGAPQSGVGGNTSAGLVYTFAAGTGDLIDIYQSPSPQAEGDYGASVALSGSTLVVGAPLEESPSDLYASGEAYLVNLISGHQTLLVSPEPYAWQEFGAAVATDGVAVVVGGPEGESGIPMPYTDGVAYLFSASSASLIRSVFTPVTFSTWSFNFGDSVAVAGSSVLVGMPFGNATPNEHYAGLAFLFNLVPLSVASPSPVEGGDFGFSVGLSNGVMIVGAPGETAGAQSGAGRAYLVTDATLGMVALQSPDPTSDGAFGSSVGIYGSAAVVGAPEENSGATHSAGNAYVFNVTTHALVLSLTSPGPEGSGLFGDSVAIDGTWIAVGAPYQGDGNAYVFYASNGTLLSTLSSPAPVSAGAFGFSVALSGNTLVVGAPGEDSHAGNAYVYTLASSGATKISTLSGAAAGNGADFGTSVAVTGSTVVVGAPYELVAGEPFGGAAYVFSTSGTQLLMLQSPNETSPGFFGYAVATNGSQILVGAAGESGDPAAPTPDSGNVYLFATGTGQLVDRYASPNGTTNGDFGDAVALGPSRSAVGAFEESGYAGEAYLFCF